MPLYPGGGSQLLGNEPITTASPTIASAQIPYVLTPDGYKQVNILLRPISNTFTIAAAASANLVPARANSRIVAFSVGVTALTAALARLNYAGSGNFAEFYLPANGQIILEFGIVPHCSINDNEALRLFNDSAGSVNFKVYCYGCYYDTSTDAFVQF